MALTQSDIVDPYVPWSGLHDYLFNDDVNAISVYIENQRPNIKKFSALQKMIEDYEKWLTNLSWTEKYFTPENAVSQAVWYRDRVNEIMGVGIPVTDIPGDIMNKKVAVNPADSPGVIGTLLNALIPEKDRKTILTIAGVAIGGYLLWIFGPAIKNTAARFSKPKNIPISYSDKYHLKGDILSPPINDIITKEDSK
jgi:hypothetical protein